MIRRGAGIGCLFLVAVLALLLLSLRGTETGRWIGGLVTVYGGAMLGGALAYETVPGSITKVNRLVPPTSYSAGSITVRYTDQQGRDQQLFRRVMMATDKFREAEVGAAVEIWVCRTDPSIVRLVGYGTHEAQACPM